uniref:Serine-threonine/tyrosine-protein kinase catalytic domain-containing protein n=3 Tax=Opuntia streptacantha TaxID=393608 RepID=A0A7C9D197_OPUST
MSPEYAMGQFSEKSDVYSFGVLLLEIVSGRKNTTFHRTELSLTLLGHAWKLWNEGQVLSFIDPTVSQPFFQADIIRCIQVGLLCVQELAKDRPSISTVISMLESEVEHLPNPKKPPFTDWDISPDDQHSKSSSANNYSISIIQGR